MRKGEQDWEGGFRRSASLGLDVPAVHTVISYDVAQERLALFCPCSLRPLGAQGVARAVVVIASWPIMRFLVHTTPASVAALIAITRVRFSMLRGPASARSRGAFFSRKTIRVCLLTLAKGVPQWGCWGSG